MNGTTVHQLATGSADILHEFPFTTTELVIMQTAVTARVAWLSKEIAAIPWTPAFEQMQKILTAQYNDASHLSYLLAEILSP